MGKNKGFDPIAHGILPKDCKIRTQGPSNHQSYGVLLGKSILLFTVELEIETHNHLRYRARTSLGFDPKVHYSYSWRTLKSGLHQSAFITGCSGIMDHIFEPKFDVPHFFSFSLSLLFCLYILSFWIPFAVSVCVITHASCTLLLEI